MNPIFNALNSGYNPQQVLQYLSTAIPSMSKSISKATRLGYDAKQILGFIAKNSDSTFRPGDSESEINAKNQAFDSKMTQYGLGALASGTLGATSLGRTIPFAQGGIQGQPPPASAPQNPIMPNPGSPTVQVGHQQVHVQPNPTPTNPNPGNSSFPTPPQVQDTLPQIALGKPKDYLDKLGITSKVDDLLKRGNNPESVAAALSMNRMGEAKIDPELLKNIEAYSQEKAVTLETTNVPQGIKPSEPLKIEKSSIVASPNGLGEVKEIRNGQALIDVDGKLHKVKEEELTHSPLPKQDLADLYDDMISGIEQETGEDVSRMVQWAGYDPESNILQFLPHDGDLYTYTDISPEDADLLRDILSVRKTSGSNFIGAWKAGSKSPIGAAMSKLIRKLQSERGGKGNEYEKKYGTVYSAYSPAIKAKKNKKKR